MFCISQGELLANIEGFRILPLLFVDYSFFKHCVLMLFFVFILKLSQPYTTSPIVNASAALSACTVSKIHLQCCHRNMDCDMALVWHLVNPLLGVFVPAQLDFRSGHSGLSALTTQNCGPKSSAIIQGCAFFKKQISNCARVLPCVNKPLCTCDGHCQRRC